MHADAADQLALLRLADLDTEAARLRHTARSLPQHKVIADLMKARQEAADAHVAASTKADDASVAVEKAEADLVPVKQRLQRDRERVADGSVTDGKVLSSLNEEIAHLGRRIQKLEDEQLELMERLDEASTRRDKLAEQRQAIEVKLREAVTERDEQVAALSQEAKELAAARGPMVAKLPAPLVSLYDRLRESSGLGAAPLRRGRCGGCQLELTVTDLDAYRKAPANEVLRCAECDRILVRTPDSGL